MDWMHILGVAVTSAPAISLYVGVILYGIHLVSQKAKFDDERWYGAVHAAIQEMHTFNISFGPDWLIKAEDAFENWYTKTHGVAPTPQQIRDGVADMARMVGPQVIPLIGAAAASMLKSKLAAPTQLPTATVGVPNPSVVVDNSTIPTQPINGGTQAVPNSSTPQKQ